MFLNRDINAPLTRRWVATFDVLESSTTMDYRDDVTLYEDLRGAHAAARADTWKRSKIMISAVLKMPAE